MVKTGQNAFIKFFFGHYILWLMRRNFAKINYNVPQFDHDKSVLLIANHFSWWDGFLLFYLNEKVFKKKFHIMVLAETVAQVFFIKHLGAFPLKKGSREMIASLKHAAKLLNDPQNLVVIFPQGKLYSNFTDTVDFERGIEWIVKSIKGGFQYVFAATFTENFEYKKPTINSYLECLEGTVLSTHELSELYMHHYGSSKLRQTQIIV